MQAVFNEFLATYGATLMYTIVTAIVGYVALVAKSMFQKYVDNQTKKDVVATCVRAVEQIYSDLKGKEKLAKCVNYIAQMLQEKGISASEAEIHLLIEASVAEFNNVFGKIDDIQFIADENENMAE